MQRGLSTASVVERLNGVGQVNQADGRGKITGTDRPGHPLPVPSFERLRQRLAYGQAQPEPFGKIARHAAEFALDAPVSPPRVLPGQFGPTAAV